MAAAASLQVYQVTLVGELCGQTTMNSFHYEVENVPAGGATVLQACAALEAGFEAADGIIDRWLDCVPNNYTLAEMWIQCVGPTQRYVKVVVPESLEGLWPDPADIATVSGVITRTTEKAGRSQVSALHIPISNRQSALVNGDLDADLLVAMGNLAALLNDQIGTPPANLSFLPVIYHGPVPFLPPDRIEAATPRTTARVMRRRTKGVGI